MTLFLKIFSALLLAAFVFSACSPKTTGGCPTGQMCTMIFTTITVEFADAAGKPVKVKNVEIFNRSSNKPIVAVGIKGPEFVLDKYVIVTDANKKELSSNGDDITVTATSIATGKTVTGVYKVSGGCNCHVQKISGPDKIVFN